MYIGGKTPYKKNPKKEVKELDEHDIEFKKKQAEDAKKMKEMASAASKKGPLSKAIISCQLPLTFYRCRKEKIKNSMKTS
jgi:hypothetical protein